jgi:uncharacterized membrane protein YfcA
MTLTDYLLLALVAMLAGAINSVAGGGTLLTFPTLSAVLIATNALGNSDALVVANATSTVALLPGSIAALWGYRQQWSAARHWIKWLIVPSLLGGWLGAQLLVSLPSHVFDGAVPWLIFTAASLFALQPTIARWTGIGKPHQAPSSATIAGIMFFQLLVAIYGGYFGAGIGILMLSALALMGLADIHVMNALKSLLGSAINGIAVVVFVIGGAVDWSMASFMALAAVVGGYGGAVMAQRTNRNLVRYFVIVVGYALAANYFYKRFLGS